MKLALIFTLLVGMAIAQDAQDCNDAGRMIGASACADKGALELCTMQDDLNGQTIYEFRCGSKVVLVGLLFGTMGCCLDQYGKVLDWSTDCFSPLMNSNGSPTKSASNKLVKCKATPIL